MSQIRYSAAVKMLQASRSSVIGVSNACGHVNAGEASTAASETPQYPS